MMSGACPACTATESFFSYSAFTSRVYVTLIFGCRSLNAVIRSSHSVGSGVQDQNDNSTTSSGSDEELLLFEPHALKKTKVKTRQVTSSILNLTFKFQHPFKIIVGRHAINSAFI